MRAVRAHAGQVNEAVRVEDGASDVGATVETELGPELVHADPLKHTSKSAHHLIS
jgi:hypothetical protein